MKDDFIENITSREEKKVITCQSTGKELDRARDVQEVKERNLEGWKRKQKDRR